MLNLRPNSLPLRYLGYEQKRELQVTELSTMVGSCCHMGSTDKEGSHTNSRTWYLTRNH